VRNVGTAPFDGSLKTGVWLDATDHQYYGPVDVRTTGKATVAPGAEADRVLVFRLPAGVQPTRLRIGPKLGGHYPTAEWTLVTSSGG
jgi:hypothetical protein